MNMQNPDAFFQKRKKQKRSKERGVDEGMPWKQALLRTVDTGYEAPVRDRASWVDAKAGDFHTTHRSSVLLQIWNIYYFSVCLLLCFCHHPGLLHSNASPKS